MAGRDLSRFACIFDSAIDYAIVAVDRQGRITDWNEGARRVLGWTSEEACGEDIDIFFTPEDRAAGISRREMRQALDAGYGPDERWHLRKDGRRFWASGEMMPLRGPAGEVDGFLKIVRDRTEQHLAAERRWHSEQSLIVNDERQRVALSASGIVGLWDWMVDTNLLHGDAHFARLYGLDPARVAAGVPMEEYQTHVVAEDLPPLRERIRAVFEQGESFLIEYRIAVPGEPIRWVECRGRMVSDGTGKPVRFSGTAIDITNRKDSEELRTLLMQEMSHRVKNMFTMVQAIVFQTLRGADTAMTERLVGRLTALSRAHDLLMHADWSATDLKGLIRQVLRFDGDGSRYDLDGPDMRIGARAGLSLSLLLHEMGTNAVKYGALSVPGGTVTVRWRTEDGQFHLDWTEQGGPPAKPPTRRGFGSRLIAMGIAGAGRAALDFGEQGLRAEFGADLATMGKD